MEEEELEEIMEGLIILILLKLSEIKFGRIFADSSSLNTYIDLIKKLFSFDKQNSKKIKLVIDSSNESFSNIAPNIFRDF